MRIVKTLSVVFSLSAFLLAAPMAQAAKENFDRSKPHMNLGVTISGEDFGEVVSMSGLGIVMPTASAAQMYSDITLKRGYTGTDDLKRWAEMSAKTAGKCEVCLRDVTVKMLSPSGEVVRTFNLMGAYPVRWELSSDSSATGDILTESITLNFERIQDQ